MASPPRPPSARPPMAAGGCLLALLTLGGAGVGVAVHQASLGLLGGFALGVVAAVLVAVWDARRR